MGRLARLIAGTLALLLLATVLILAATALRASSLQARANTSFPPLGRFVEAEGARLHYVDAGRPGQPVVVLIHGNPGTGRDFDRLIPILAPNHRVIAIDRPGHGHSERPDLEGASPLVQARQLHAALEQLGATTPAPILVGHSWGGALALAYAIEYPRETRGMLLLGTRAYPVGEPPDPLYALLRRPVIGPLLRWTVVPVLGRGTLDRRLSAAYQPDSVQAEHVAQARALWMRPGQLGATVWDTFLLQRDAGAMASRYSSVGAPVMLLVGDGDSRLSESEQLATHLPNAWIEILPGAGHYLPRTRLLEIQRSLAVLEARMRAASPRADPT